MMRLLKTVICKIIKEELMDFFSTNLTSFVKVFLLVYSFYIIACFTKQSYCVAMWWIIKRKKIPFVVVNEIPLNLMRLLLGFV